METFCFDNGKISCSTEYFVFGQVSLAIAYGVLDMQASCTPKLPTNQSIFREVPHLPEFKYEKLGTS